MKYLLITFLVCLTTITAKAQLSSGLNPTEAKEMIMLCNSYTYLDLYKNDEAIIPHGYKCIYTSPVIGMDNKFQVYTKGKTGILNFRGSTDKKISWMENLYAAMIPVKGEIKYGEQTFSYKFAKDTAARVHSGFTLALAYLHDDVIDQINKLNDQGIYDIILTGHSQGGALVILLRSYLHYSKEVSNKNRFKVYTYGQPMSGNKEFIAEYNKNFCDPGMSYSFINPEDDVTRMPISRSESSFKENLLAMVSGDEGFDRKNFMMESLLILFEDRLKSMSERLSGSVAEQIHKELGTFVMPEQSGEVDYVQVGNMNEIQPPYYPLEMKDSSLLEDSLFMAEHPRDNNGIFLNKGVYKKITMAQHHKPYNYYTGILRKYFPKEYDAIEPKSFGLQ